MVTTFDSLKIFVWEFLHNIMFWGFFLRPQTLIQQKDKLQMTFFNICHGVVKLKNYQCLWVKNQYRNLCRLYGLLNYMTFVNAAMCVNTESLTVPGPLSIMDQVSCWLMLMHILHVIGYILLISLNDVTDLECVRQRKCIFILLWLEW